MLFDFQWLCIDADFKSLLHNETQKPIENVKSDQIHVKVTVDMYDVDEPSA